MADVALVGLVIGFLGLCVAYVRWLDRMIRSADESSVPAATSAATADRSPETS